jgi:hypothetical protein
MFRDQSRVDRFPDVTNRIHQRTIQVEQHAFAMRLHGRSMADAVLLLKGF